MCVSLYSRSAKEMLFIQWIDSVAQEQHTYAHWWPPSSLEGLDLSWKWEKTNPTVQASKLGKCKKNPTEQGKGNTILETIETIYCGARRKTQKGYNFNKMQEDVIFIRVTI